MGASQRLFFYIVPLCIICPLLTAQDLSDLKPGRFELSPLASFRTGMSFALEPSVQGAPSRVVLDSTAAYGLVLGVHLRKDDVLEFRWSKQYSNVEILNSAAGFAPASMILNHFHCDFSHEYVLKQRALLPFIMASVGATNVSDGVNSSSINLSAGIGGGLKFFVSQHLGFRIQAEWLPTFVGSPDLSICGVGCVVHLGGALGSQAEIAVGPVLRF